MERNSSSMKKIILTFIGIVAIFLAVSNLGTLTLVRFTRNYRVLSCVLQGVASVAAIAYLMLMKKGDALKFSFTGFGTGVAVAGYLLVMEIAVPLIGAFASTFEEPGVEFALTADTLMLVLYALLVGVTEEVFFRGLLQNIALDYTGRDTVKGVRKGILITSLMFSLFHMVNLTTGNNLSSVLVQMLGVIPIGIILGAMYFRSKDNLWVCILIHGLVDGAGFIATQALSGANTTTEIIAATGTASVSKYGVIAISFIVAAFVLRKKAIEKGIVFRANA